MSALSHLGDMSVSERKTWEKRLLQELSSLRRISGGRSWARICGERRSDLFDDLMGGDVFWTPFSGLGI